MAKPVPRTSQLAPCPLRPRPGPPLLAPRHLIWRDATGWVVAFGTPAFCGVIVAGLPCWHFALDSVTRWDRDPDNPDDPGGWITPAFRHNTGLELPDGQLVCNVCYADLTGSRT